MVVLWILLFSVWILWHQLKKQSSFFLSFFLYLSSWDVRIRKSFVCFRRVFYEPVLHKFMGLNLVKKINNAFINSIVKVTYLCGCLFLRKFGWKKIKTIWMKKYEGKKIGKMERKFEWKKKKNFLFGNQN